MPIPDHLDDWRRYLLRPAPPLPSAPADRSPASKHAFNSSRLQYLAELTLVTPDLAAIEKAVRLLALDATTGALSPRGLAISGRPSTGKTTAAISVAKQHERRTRTRYGWEDDDSVQPTVYVVTPPATTPKMLMVAFCLFLGIPYRRTDTAQELSERVVHTLRELRTSLIVLDEIHNLQSNRRVGAEAASTLKLFAERLDAVLLYAGVDLTSSDTFAGPIGDQLASRMALHHMDHFHRRSAADRSQWRSLLVSFEAHLTLLNQQPGSILTLSDNLYEATGGYIGRLSTLLRRTAILAIENESEQLTAELLAAVPNSVPTPMRLTPDQVDGAQAAS